MMEFKSLSLSEASIEKLQPEGIGYIGAIGYGFIRVFEREARTFAHRCWKGHTIQYGDAAHVFDQALCDFDSLEDAQKNARVFYSEHGLTRAFAEFACGELGIPYALWVNTTPM